MRVLHPIGAQERFLASGEYLYATADTTLQVREQWSIHLLAGGALIYRVDEDGRDEDGLSILSEALISPGNIVERYNVQSFNHRDASLQPYKADYMFHSGYVQISSQTGTDERTYSEFPLMDGAIPYIKQTVFMGLTIERIAARGGTSQVFTPALLSLDEPQMQKLIIKSHGTDQVQVSQRSIAAERVQIADEVFYWIDDHLIPVRREFTYAGKSYVVTLANYAYSGS